MKTEQIKQRLHRYIETADEKELKAYLYNSGRRD